MLITDHDHDKAGGRSEKREGLADINMMRMMLMLMMMLMLLMLMMTRRGLGERRGPADKLEPANRHHSLLHYTTYTMYKTLYNTCIQHNITLYCCIHVIKLYSCVQHIHV